MEISSVFVTGANRGIGLEFVRQFVLLPTPPKYVFASYRDEETAKELFKLRDDTKSSKIVTIKMDVSVLEDVKTAAKVMHNTLGDEGLNFLINNAGVLKLCKFPEITEENLLLHIRTNTLGPVTVLQEFLPALKKSADRNSGLKMGVSKAAVLNISSMGGSIADAYDQPRGIIKYVSYKTSKAALNMAMRSIAATLADKGILVVNICPGLVKTDMTRERGVIDTCESISSMLKLLPSLDKSKHGSYVNRFGEPINF